MIGVSIQFLTGRFHATPWGRHVNEAAPEWPPSPWRLLRAFVATWKRKLNDDVRCREDIMFRLFKSLSAPPLFSLPSASTGHARHYMPKMKPSDKTLVFDSWTVVDKDDKLLCLWPEVILNDQEQSALVAVTENLGTLGRSESWVEACVLSSQEASAAEGKINCAPQADSSHMKSVESIRMLCIDVETAFDNEFTPKNKSIEGKGKNKQEIVTPIYAPDWHLCMETLELHAKKWSDPPGAKWITYARPQNCFESQPASQRVSRVQRDRPTIARFAVDAAVLPLVEDTLKVAEKARITAMGCFRRVEEQRLSGRVTMEGQSMPKSEVFSGKDTTGIPLQGHQHAYYLPADEDGDGRIDHLTIIAETGFGPSEHKAIDRMRSLRLNDAEPLNLVLTALGQTQYIRAEKILGPSAVWISATPFIVTRHAKTRGSKKDPSDPHKFAEIVLKEEIDRLRERRPDIPALFSIEPLNNEHRIGAHRARSIQFKKYRQKHSDDGGRRASGAFRIVFSGPVTGPICLGHSSHFGLGLFVPVFE